MNQTLMKAVLDLAAFIELSGDDVVDPDAATEQLDDLAAVLGQLPQTEKEEFISFIDRLVNDQREHGASKELTEFLLSFPESFGLRE